MARILPVVLAASVAAHVTRAANQCTCMGPCEKRPIPFVHPRPERRWCYTSGECGQWSVLRWAYWDWCDTNPPGMVDNPALCGPRYGTSSTTTVSAGKSACARKGAPLRRRHVAQWQMERPTCLGS